MRLYAVDEIPQVGRILRLVARQQDFRSIRTEDLQHSRPVAGLSGREQRRAGLRRRMRTFWERSVPA